MTDQIKYVKAFFNKKNELIIKSNDPTGKELVRDFFYAKYYRNTLEKRENGDSFFAIKESESLFELLEQTSIDFSKFEFYISSENGYPVKQLRKIKNGFVCGYARLTYEVHCQPMVFKWSANYDSKYCVKAISSRISEDETVLEPLNAPYGIRILEDFESKFKNAGYNMNFLLIKGKVKRPDSND